MRETQRTILAQDGSWTTGVIGPRLFEYVACEAPGTYRSTSAGHPWALGEITVVL